MAEISMNTQIKLPTLRQVELIHNAAKKEREYKSDLTYDDSLIMAAWKMAWDNCQFQLMSGYKKP